LRPAHWAGRNASQWRSIGDAGTESFTEAAWDAYAHSRKSPQTRKAGPGFSDPDYELAVDWIAAHEAVQAAQRQYEDRGGPNRFLLINASSRSEHTCLTLVDS
jgi:hypothetical protein